MKDEEMSLNPVRVGVKNPGNENINASQECYLIAQSKPIFDDFDSDLPSPTQCTIQQRKVNYGSKVEETFEGMRIELKAD